MVPSLALAGLSFAAGLTSVLAATAGSFDDGGNTKVSAMMMFLGNENSVYILDKAEANAAQVNGHSAWGSLWDITTRKTKVMDIKSNSFCASGMHLPNGSFVTFGGNDAVTTGGAVGSQKNPDGTGFWDSTYQDSDGRRAIRMVTPCTINDNLDAGQCLWFDDDTLLAMKKRRWYSTVEPTGTGQIVIMGGMVTGGYINRWYPNEDPATSKGLAEPTYEYYPAVDGDPQVLQFMVKTSGLNAYPHAFLMPSGKILLQANYSTILWDHKANQETPLPDMPKQIIRVYPASGATAMLPLTPDNNYTPTLLFCGGSDMPEYNWGDYRFPFVDPWNIPASKDCQRLTPEPQDGSQPTYQQDDDMLDGRTMGQFIILPDGKLLVINGGRNGTAGYAKGTMQTPNLADQPFGTSLASDPVFSPAVYDPNAPAGQKWSNAGMGASQIPRLYHSSAILLPDGSVMVAGSNPNPDVNTQTVFNTEYRAEVFYPSYFSASVRPNPQGVPQTLSYGGSYFNITLGKDSYTGAGNDAADATKVVLIRGGFTTHAMNMGQRYLQLNNTYTVNKDSTITLHVSQVPPNANILQPGPALLFVVVNGVPSTGKYLIVGNGIIGDQPTQPAADLPVKARFDTASGGGSASSSSGGATGGLSSTTKIIIGVAAGAGLLLLIFGVFFLRRRRQQQQQRRGGVGTISEKGLGTSSGYPLSSFAPAALGASL